MLIMVLVSLLLMLEAGCALAQSNETEAILDDARKQINQIRKGLTEQTDDAGLLKWRAEVLSIQARAQGAVETLSFQSDSVVARQTEIGKPPNRARKHPTSRRSARSWRKAAPPWTDK